MHPYNTAEEKDNAVNSLQVPPEGRPADWRAILEDKTGEAAW